MSGGCCFGFWFLSLGLGCCCGWWWLLGGVWWCWGVLGVLWGVGVGVGCGVGLVWGGVCGVLVVWWVLGRLVVWFFLGLFVCGMGISFDFISGCSACVGYNKGSGLYHLPYLANVIKPE
ncbi:hypothetical protein RA268_28045, partial [Pseudomonas syringae pv. tagetis]